MKANLSRNETDRTVTRTTGISRRLLVSAAIIVVLIATGCFTSGEQPPQTTAENPVAQRLQAKAEQAKSAVQQLHQSGIDVRPLVAMMQQVEPRIEKGDVVGAEKVLDEVLRQVALRTGGGEGPAAAGGPFSAPVPVTVRGYTDHVMEPFVTRDGHYLFFNNSNNPNVDTNLHWATRVDDVTFQYQGELRGANTDQLDAVASVDRAGLMYFISSRSYAQTKRTIHSGRFVGDRLIDPQVVPGDISREREPYLSMDAEISADGDALYFTDNEFGEGGYPKTSNLKIAERINGVFHTLPNSDRLLANINTNALEYAPATSPDQLTLYFTRANLEQLQTLRGGAELGIYMATRRSAAEPFGQPVKIESIQGFVEAPTVAADGTSIYFHRNEGGKFQLFRVERNQSP